MLGRSQNTNSPISQKKSIKLATDQINVMKSSPTTFKPLDVH